MWLIVKSAELFHVSLKQKFTVNIELIEYLLKNQNVLKHDTSYQYLKILSLNFQILLNIYIFHYNFFFKNYQLMQPHSIKRKKI